MSDVDPSDMHPGNVFLAELDAAIGRHGGGTVALREALERFLDDERARASMRTLWRLGIPEPEAARAAILAAFGFRGDRP